MSPPHGGGGVAAFPKPTAYALFSACLTGFVLFMLPLVLLQHVDALLAFTTGSRVLRDALLAASLAVVPALLLAALGKGAHWAARRLGLDHGRADRLAWAVVLVPTAWLSAWQVARAGLAWLRPHLQSGMLGTPGDRVPLMLAMLALLALLAWRLGSARLVRFAVEPLFAMRPLAVLVVAVAWIANAVVPPAIAGGEGVARPAAAVPARALPDVFLITIDTLSAADASPCGSGPTTMPRLRAFADQATCFSRHYAVSNFTTPTTSTMETGVLPWSHWAVQIGAKVAPALQDRSLAGALAQAGYRTHSISANFLASPRHHGTHAAWHTERLARSTALEDRLVGAPISAFAESTLPVWLQSLFPFIGSLDMHLHADRSPVDPRMAYGEVPALLQQPGPARAPLFVWTHTMPPHSPYLPPKSTKYRLLPPGELEQWRDFLPDNSSYPPARQPLVDKHRLRYRESMMGADEALGEFLDMLQREGRLDGALVIVSSDHGESFERGLLGHAGHLLHDALVRVPLVVKLPGQRAGRVVDMPVSQADLVPTVLDVAGVPALPEVDGRSLRRLLEGAPLPPAPVVTMAMMRQSRFRPLSSGDYAVIDGGWKLELQLPSGQRRLFDLAQDPHERNDVAAAQPEVAARLDAWLRQRLAAAEAARRRAFGS